jgi:hypothetical protein
MDGGSEGKAVREKQRRKVEGESREGESVILRCCVLCVRGDFHKDKLVRND